MHHVYQVYLIHCFPDTAVELQSLCETFFLLKLPSLYELSLSCF